MIDIDGINKNNIYIISAVFGRGVDSFCHNLALERGRGRDRGRERGRKRVISFFGWF